MSMSRSDILEMREGFPARWAEFLRATYANPEEVASAFAVRHSTAWNWWTGLNAPSGPAVALAMLLHPAAVRRLVAA